MSNAGPEPPTRPRSGSPAEPGTGPTRPDVLLEVRGLGVDHRRRGGWTPAVRDVGLSLRAGETVAVVGESGSGKTTLVKALTRTLPAGGRMRAERLRYDGQDLMAAGERVLRGLRGREIGVVPQDPMMSLNPVRRVGDQVAETLLIHRITDRASARRRAVEQLDRAGLPDPERAARRFPHELSGGMRQRVLIAAALVAGPRLLICDEPTSALDVSIQRQVLDRIAALARESGIAVLLVTHDLAVAAEYADRIAVMSAGGLIEHGETVELLTVPRQPYTRRLLACALDPAPDRATLAARPPASASTARIAGTNAAGMVLLEVRGLRKRYPTTAGGGAGGRGADPPFAVDGIDLTVPRGCTVGLVGESGSGKSSTARLITGLERPTGGRITFDGVELADRSGRRRGRGRDRIRGRIQLVQQNPYGALDPRFTIERSLLEPLRGTGLGSSQRRATAAAMAERVGLPLDVLGRRPSELSGGQRQRVVLARAIVTGPDLVVCDEPVAALDAETSVRILRLLAELQDELGLSYLFITHDLAVASRFCQRIAVLRQGRIVESGPTREVFDSPRDPYTRRLLESLPSPPNPSSCRR